MLVQVVRVLVPVLTLMLAMVVVAVVVVVAAAAAVVDAEDMLVLVTVAIMTSTTMKIGITMVANIVSMSVRALVMTAGQLLHHSCCGFSL